MNLISIDAGKYHTCCVNAETELMFKTRVREIPTYDPDLDRVIQIDGVYYSLGEDDGEIDATPSKLTPNHKLCTLYGITQLYPDLETNADIHLVTTCPYNHFDNADAKKKYKDFYVGSYSLQVDNDKHFKFNIVDVLVMPESAGVVYSNSRTFKDNLVGVIDWGGLQVNCMIYDDCKMIKSSGFTSQLGGYSVETDILNTLNKVNVGANYQYYEIKYILRNKKPEISNEVTKLVTTQIDKIISECRKKNWNFDMLKLLWTGGSSLRFQEYLNSRGYMVSEHALMDNARGNMEVGKAWLRKLNK